MLKTFQLRAARSVTGIEVRELGLYLGISRTIISRWENQPLFDTIKTKKASPAAMLFFFKQHNILFPDENTVQFNSKLNSESSNHLTRFQLRASRAALDLTQETLAELIGIPKATINYLETQSNKTLLNTTNKGGYEKIFQEFFTKKGVSYPDNFTIKLSQTPLK